MASACTVARMDDRVSLMFDVGAKRPRDAPVPVHHATRHQTAMTSSCSANGDNTSDEEDGASEPHSSREFPSSSSGASAQVSPKRARATREGVRRGKWTLEEQAYADRLIRDFEAGLLPLENGATLRAYLSKKLNCDPMRISKKFAGAKCLGKVRYTLFLKISPVKCMSLLSPSSLPLRYPPSLPLPSSSSLPSPSISLPLLLFFSQQIFLKRADGQAVVAPEPSREHDAALEALRAAFLHSISAAGAGASRRRNRAAKEDKAAVAAARAAPRPIGGKTGASDGETDEGSESDEAIRPAGGLSGGGIGFGMYGGMDGDDAASGCLSSGASDYDGASDDMGHVDDGLQGARRHSRHFSEGLGVMDLDMENAMMSLANGGGGGFEELIGFGDSSYGRSQHPLPPLPSSCAAAARLPKAARTTTKNRLQKQASVARGSVGKSSRPGGGAAAASRPTPPSSFAAARSVAVPSAGRASSSGALAAWGGGDDELQSLFASSLVEPLGDFLPDECFSLA